MSLLTNLIAHWKLNEASGTRVDSHGANDLTDVNTVASTTGILGDAARCVRANSEQLTLADNADMSVGGTDFTFAAWVRLPDKTVGAATDLHGIATKDSITSGNREWLLYWDKNTDRFTFATGRGSGTTVDGVTANTFGAPPQNTWIFIVAWHDRTAGKNFISINNGTANEAVYTTGPSDGTALFRIGLLGTATHFLHGDVDSASFWKRTLTADERTDLYNAGAGLDYEDYGGGSGGQSITPGLLTDAESLFTATLTAQYEITAPLLTDSETLFTHTVPGGVYTVTAPLLSDSESLFTHTIDPRVPTVLSNPQSITRAIGSTAVFNVTASGTEPLSYQWRKDEVNIGGATSSSLTILDVAESDAGSYDCVVTNSEGSDTSAAAVLTVVLTSATLLFRSPGYGRILRRRAFV